MSPRKGPSIAPDSSEENFSRFFGNAYFSAITWRGYLFMLAILIFLTALCSRIALLNIVAYEFAAVIGLIVSHFTAALVIREFDRLRAKLAHRSPYSPGPHSRLVIWGVVLGSVAAAGWLMFLPLIELIFLDLIMGTRNCDLMTGIGFYVTIPLISSFFAASLAAFASLATSSRRNAGLLYALIVILFVIRIIFRLAFGHTIGLHDPFIGSLNLPLYDEEANLETGFVYSRLFLLVVSTLLISITILFADRRFQNYSAKNLFSSLRSSSVFLPETQTIIVLGVLTILGFCFQGPLGMEITRRYLEHRLDGRLETEHFVMYFPTGGEVEDDIERLAEEHEFYYWSIVNEIGVAPEGPIRAYIYPDRQLKTFLTGVGSGVYAKPWTGEIHVEYNRTRIRALKHELVHVISAPMGVPVFGSSMLGAYGEGIAEGVQWATENDLTYHQWAAVLRVADDPHFDRTFFPRDEAPVQLLTRNFRPGGFYVGRTGMNYYLGASHTRWFLDTYGPEAYGTAYIRNDTVRAIGISQEDAARSWMEYLDHVPLRADEINFAELAFAPPKFVTTVCAHEVAEHERIAGEHTQFQAWRYAYDEYEILLDFSRKNMRYGYWQARILYYAEDFDAALARIGALSEWETSEGWESYLSLLAGDIYARMGQHAEAAEAYDEAYNEALTMSVRDSALLRMEILESPAMEEFLAAMRDSEDARWRYERARSVDEGWLPLYFLGGDLVGDRMYEEAGEVLLECLRLHPPYRFVRRDCLYRLGICAYRDERYSEARERFQDAGLIAADIFLEDHPDYDGVIPLHRLDSWSSSCSDWLSRCDWRETWPGIISEDDE